MHQNAKAKYNAAKYELNRLRSVYTDTGGQVNNIDAQQAFFHFCAEIYGLHDWLIHETSIDKTTWEKFLSGTDCLFLVAKIETMNKHEVATHAFWLTRHLEIRTNNHMVLIPPQASLSHWVTQAKYTITTDGIEVDSLALAEGALRELNNFLVAHGIFLES